MTFSFNLLHQPWLPGLTLEGKPAELTLREALLNAHHYRELSAESPLLTIAIHRLLLTILHRVFGPKNMSAWGDLWHNQQFPAAPLETYFDKWQHRFDLFDTSHPFMQTPDPRMKSKSIINLVTDMASGNNATLFNHHTEEQGVSLTPAESGRALLAGQLFGLAGLSGIPDKFTDSPGARGVHFFAEGQNLFETLLLNLPQYPTEEGEIPSLPEDKPAWESDNPYLPERETPLGYLDYLTWPSRRILLEATLVNNQPVVRTMTIGPGLRLSPNVRDPFKHYRIDEERGYLVHRFNEDKALWRNSHAFLAVAKGQQNFHQTWRPPLAFHWLEKLVFRGYIDIQKTYHFLALGMANDQAKVEFFQTERMPLPLAYLQNEQLVQSLQESLVKAEETWQTLRFATQILAMYIYGSVPDEPTDGKRWAKLNKDTKERANAWLTSSGTERNYWHQLELPFLRLLQDLPQDIGTAQEAWNTLLRQTAEQAFEHCAQYAGEDAKALKAAVHGRRQLHAGLNKLFPQPEVNHA